MTPHFTVPLYLLWPWLLTRALEFNKNHPTVSNEDVIGKATTTCSHDLFSKPTSRPGKLVCRSFDFGFEGELIGCHSTPKSPSIFRDCEMYQG